ncbi:MAG: TolC family protein [Saprospiraceae bacterium]|nr:TolC family protein [Saprospiraceae bacterium]
MRSYLIILCALIASNLFGQEVRKLSLNEAVETAIKNAIEIQNLKLDEAIQLAQNNEIKGSALPQIAADGQLTYYTNVPQIPFPSSDISIYQVLEKEGVRDNNGNPINVGNASFGIQAVSFVAPLNYQYGVGVQQLLFQPDVFVALQARQSVLDLARGNTEVAIEKVKEAVQKAYYSVLVAQNQKSVIDATMQRLDKLNFEMGQMYKNGFVEKLDVDRLSVTLNNTKTAQNQINNGIAINLAVLKNALGISQKDSVVLTDQLDVNALQADIVKFGQDVNYQDRSEYRLLSIAKRLQELDIKRSKMAYFPTVAAFYQFQRSGQKNDIYDVNGSGPWFAFNTGLVGLSIKQPIYDGGQKKFKIQQAKLKLEKIENTSIELSRYIDLENNIAKNSLTNAVLNLEVQKRNMELAESVFTSTTKKYQSGLGSSFEVLQTDTEVQRANGSYFQALYDAYIAKVNYLKSIGKL